MVIWPQQQVVSHQTFAFLNTVGMPKLEASDAVDYVRIATELASDTDRLKGLASGCGIG